MKKAILCILLCVTLLMPISCFAAGEGMAAADSILQGTFAQTFTVVHTGDINGVEEETDTAIGFAKASGLANAHKTETATLLLDSGNALGGDGGKTIQIMEAAQYTAAAIGTRDAALGIERLQELSARANFPLLCANWLMMDGELLFEPYVIVEVGNVNVGVIGLISPSIAETYPEITQGCNVYKPSGIANIYYDEMVEQGCTYFIALTSLGYDGEYTPRDLGTESPWINLILDSNSGTVLDMGELIGQTNVIAFNLEPDFAQVGEITVTTGTADGMNTTLPSVYTVEDLKEIEADEAVQAVVDAQYVEPGTEMDSSDGEIDSTGNEGTVTTNNAVSPVLLYMLCFVGVIAVTAVIVVMMMKKPSNKKK